MAYQTFSGGLGEGSVQPTSTSTNRICRIVVLSVNMSP